VIGIFGGLQNKYFIKTYIKLKINITTYGEKSCSIFSLLLFNTVSTIWLSSLIKSHSKGSKGVFKSKNEINDNKL